MHPIFVFACCVKPSREPDVHILHFRCEMRLIHLGKLHCGAFHCLHTTMWECPVVHGEHCRRGRELYYTRPSARFIKVSAREPHQSCVCGCACVCVSRTECGICPHDGCSRTPACPDGPAPHTVPLSGSVSDTITQGCLLSCPLFVSTCSTRNICIHIGNVSMLMATTRNAQFPLPVRCLQWR